MKKLFFTAGIFISLHVNAQYVKEDFKGKIAKYLNGQNVGVLVDSVSCYIIKIKTAKSGRIKKVDIFYENQAGFQVMRADDTGSGYVITDILKDEKKLAVSTKANTYLFPFILGHLHDGTPVNSAKILTYRGIEQLIHLLAIANMGSGQVLAPAVVNVEQSYY